MDELFVFIGRFQPLHLEHERIIKSLLNENPSARVLVLVGSANLSRSVKNPFTFYERKEMLLDSIESSRLYIDALNDFYNDNDWLQEVYRLIKLCSLRDTNVKIVGCNKDESSYQTVFGNITHNYIVLFIFTTFYESKIFKTQANSSLGSGYIV